MEKRVIFRHKTRPYLLVAPQLAITAIADSGARATWTLDTLLPDSFQLPGRDT